MAANASLRYLGYPSTHFIVLDIAPIIEEHTSTAELLAALHKMTSWAKTYAEWHDLSDQGPCRTDIREAQSLLTKHTTK